MKFILATLIIILSATLLGCAGKQVIDLRTSGQKKSSDFALLHLPIDIDVVHHNQKLLNTRPFYQQSVTYRLAPGPHTIGLQYNNLVPNEDGVKETVKSHVVQITFAAENGREYYIPFKKPYSYNEAVSLSKNLELKLFTGEELITTSVVNDLWEVSARSAEDILNENNEDGTVKKLSLPAADAPAGQHLEYWWQQASEQEKSRFFYLITQNPAHLKN